ncbi:hypothetical protein AC3_1396 [Clostridium perfringens E str. JGS1987]|uniref:Uncharacterized protein n=1 Tax=Clostridium perfringens E str. JGS1987 TaxID=451755 RepID=B1BUD1_CLOPF|nr:hypothetical protein AC3_1396 [Clostridium perfringens E str. JGS1987]
MFITQGLYLGMSLIITKNILNKKGWDGIYEEITTIQS